MATIRKELTLNASPAQVWDVIRDVGAVHRRLAPGFVTDTRLEEGARIVTFANGVVARELIVSVEEDVQRLVWSVVGGRATHQLFVPGGCGRRRRHPAGVDHGPVARYGRAGAPRDDRAGLAGDSVNAGIAQLPPA